MSYLNFFLILSTYPGLQCGSKKCGRWTIWIIYYFNCCYSPKMTARFFFILGGLESCLWVIKCTTAEAGTIVWISTAGQREMEEIRASVMGWRAENESKDSGHHFCPLISPNVSTKEMSMEGPHWVQCSARNWTI